MPRIAPSPPGACCWDQTWHAKSCLAPLGSGAEPCGSGAFLVETGASWAGLLRAVPATNPKGCVFFSETRPPKMAGFSSCVPLKPQNRGYPKKQKDPPKPNLLGWFPWLGQNKYEIFTPVPGCWNSSPVATTLHPTTTVDRRLFQVVPPVSFCRNPCEFMLRAKNAAWLAQPPFFSGTTS